MKHEKLAGFSPDHIWEIEGSWKEMQCDRGCHDTLYPLFPLIPDMVASEKNMRISPKLVPRCPKCGGTMSIHSPQRYMAAADREMQRRFQDFVEKYDFSGKKIVLFATSGGSGFGNTAAELKGSVSASARIIEGKLLNGRVSKAELEKWVQDLNL